MIVIPKPGQIINTKLPKTSSPKISFGEMLRTIRICDEGLPLSFAKRLGLTLDELYAIEQGQTAITEEMAKEFADRLSAEPSFFLKHL